LISHCAHAIYDGPSKLARFLSPSVMGETGLYLRHARRIGYSTEYDAPSKLARTPPPPSNACDLPSDWEWHPLSVLLRPWREHRP